MKAIILTAICSLTITVGLASAGEKKVNIKDLPPAVQKSIQAETANAAITGIARDVEDGKTIYEVEMKLNGHGRSLDLDTQGKVLSMEEEVALDSLPAPAKTAIGKLAAGGRVTKVEKVTVAGKTSYEAALTVKGKKSEVMVGEDGAVLK